MLEAGTGKADITTFVKGVGMMGYGMSSQTVKGVETPLSARAVVIHHPKSGNKIAFVNAEMCFITLAIQSAVIKKLQAKHPDLGLNESNVMLTAQHTHNGPGGYSHYAFFNFSIPGFASEVFEQKVNGITQSIVEAAHSLQPVELRLDTGRFPDNVEVAFNRSMSAYNANPEVEKLSEEDNHLALDRIMTLIRLDTPEGNTIATINWFGIHTTSIGNDMHKICYDNKGYASDFMENQLQKKNKNCIAIFAQAPCGDIIPNYIWEPSRNRKRGKYADDYKSAEHNGKLQFKKAHETYLKAEGQSQLEIKEIDHALMYVDLSDVRIDDEFIPSHHPDKGKKVTTSHACMGVAFFKGTVDGRGISDGLAKFASLLSKATKTSEQAKALLAPKEKWKEIAHKYKSQGKKDILIETGKGKILGTANIQKLGHLTKLDPTFSTLRKQYDKGALKSPWTPEILPLQIIILGTIAIVGVPAEISFIGGKRLQQTLENILKERGVNEVLISPYANAYSGYITTNEEYQLQYYEGGHTVFGEWTLAAYQTAFKRLAIEMLKKESDRNLDPETKPHEFTNEEIQLRSFGSLEEQSTTPA
jgi:neutral ceramidase